MRKPILFLALLLPARVSGLRAQVEYHARLGAVGASNLLRDVIVNEITVRQSIAPMIALGGLAPDRAARLSRRPRGHASPPASFTAARSGSDTDLGTLRTGTLMLGLEGPLYQDVPLARRSWAASGTGRPTRRGSSAPGGTTRFLAGAGVDYRRPVMAKWDLMTRCDYDFHRFTTGELKTRGFGQTQGVSRVVAVRRPARGLPDEPRGLAGWPPPSSSPARRAATSPRRSGTISTSGASIVPDADAGPATTASPSTGRSERLPVRIWVEDAAGLLAEHPRGHRRLATRVPVRGIRRDDRQRLEHGRRDRARRGGARRPVLPDPAAQRARAGVRGGHGPGHQRRPHRSCGCRSGSTSTRKPDPTAPDLPACLALTTTHELGHALGIWRHSTAATDLMFSDPAVDAPSERDLATAEMIYHVPANVEAVGRWAGGRAGRRAGGQAGGAARRGDSRAPSPSERPAPPDGHRRPLPALEPARSHPAQLNFPPIRLPLPVVSGASTCR